MDKKSLGSNIYIDQPWYKNVKVVFIDRLSLKAGVNVKFIIMWTQIRESLV